MKKKKTAKAEIAALNESLDQANAAEDRQNAELSLSRNAQQRLYLMTMDALTLLHSTLQMARAMTREGKALNCSPEWAHFTTAAETRLAECTIDIARAMVHCNQLTGQWLQPEAEPKETDQAQAA